MRDINWVIKMEGKRGKMNKKELKLYTIRMMFLGFAIGLLVMVVIAGIYSISDYKKNKLLQEDYNWLSDSAQSCWDRLRPLDNTCWTPSDCAKNESLIGCRKIDCNHCCDGMCTLMYCGDLDKLKDYSNNSIEVVYTENVLYVPDTIKGIII